MSSETINDNTPRHNTYRLVAVFHKVADAQKSLDKLRADAIPPEAISFVTRDRSVQHQQHATGVEGLTIGDSALIGTLGGGSLGAVLGWLVAGGATLIPGVGLVVAAGAVATALGGALVGGSLGGIAGAMLGNSVPPEETQEYAEMVKGERTVITVDVLDQAELHTAGDILQRQGASNIRYYDLRQVGSGMPYPPNQAQPGDTATYLEND